MALAPWRKCILITVLSYLFLVGLAILVFYLVVKPKNPVLMVDQASIRGYNLTEDGHLTNTTIDLIIRFYNPNKKLSFVYKNILIGVYLHDGPLVGSNMVVTQPFLQHVGNETTLPFHADAVNVVLNPTTVSILRAQNSRGEVDLDVYVKAVFQFKLGSVATKLHLMKGNCSPVVVSLSSDQNPHKRYCRVKVRNY